MNKQKPLYTFDELVRVKLTQEAREYLHHRVVATFRGHKQWITVEFEDVKNTIFRIINIVRDGSGIGYVCRNEEEGYNIALPEDIVDFAF